MYRRIILSILLICALLKGSIIVAQNDTIQDSTTHFEYDYVRWVNEFPPSQKDGIYGGIVKTVGEFIFGKKTKVLEKPVSVVAESQNKIWAIDQKNSSIVFIEKNKGELMKFKTNEEQFLSSMVSLCIVPNSGFIFSDSRSNEVFFLKNGSVELVPLGDSIDWQQPTGVAFSVINSEIWVIETKAHRISIINSDGVLQKVIGNKGSGPGEFNFPTHIWIDSEGFAYVVDAMNFRVQIFNSNGDFVSMFGQAGDATGFFARPKGIATDSFGNIYVVDALFHVVQIFNKSGELLYFFGSQGREKGEFWMPSGIFIDQKNTIFVADTYNSRIQVFHLINNE